MLRYAATTLNIRKCVRVVAIELTRTEPGMVVLSCWEIMDIVAELMVCRMRYERRLLPDRNRIQLGRQGAVRTGTYRP